MPTTESDSLVALAKFKQALRVDPADTDDDALFLESLADASAAVQDYIERDFLSPAVTQERTFSYDGSGVLDIDDASAIHAVYLNDSAVELPAHYWTPHSIVAGQSYVWIELPPLEQQRSSSPEMGFTRNEDRLFGSYRVSNSVTVDADWGWNDVPRAVQRATIYVASIFLLDPRGGAAGIASESVAEVARAYVSSQGLEDQGAIPLRAQQLLDPYARR